MGRQFSISGTPSDMRRLHAEVARRQGRLLHRTGPDKAPLPVTDSSLHTQLVIAPPGELLLRYAKTASGWAIDSTSSQVVELSAGHGPDGVPRVRPPGRLWVSTLLGYDENGDPLRPDPAFLRWADGLFRWTKSRWRLHDGTYFGPEADASWQPAEPVRWRVVQQATVPSSDAAELVATWRQELGYPDDLTQVQVTTVDGLTEVTLQLRD